MNEERNNVSRNDVATGTRARRLMARALVGTFVASILVIAPAYADSYRYWSYLLGQDNQWAMAQTGPGDRVLSDRDVDGWQFGIFGVEGGSTPEQAPDFAALCPELEAAGPAQGQVRVAVVIDSGTPQEAPTGETPIPDSVACISIPAGSNGYQALAKAASVRTDSGMVCGIDGYPATECATVITDSPSPQVTTQGSEGDTSDVSADEPLGAAPSQLWLWLAAALVVAAVLAIAVRRRRRLH
jgi:hypothetical protein